MAPAGGLACDVPSPGGAVPGAVSAWRAGLCENHHCPLPAGAGRPEKELRAQFQAAQPRILGALLNAVSGGLKELPSTCLPRLPRMADFALFATAAELALRWPRHSFLIAYSGNREAANDLALEG